MTIRHWLAQLSDPAGRRTFGRTWLGVCLSAALCHIFLNIVVFHDPYVFFVLAVWLAVVYAPVRIAVEVLHVVGPRLRRQLEQKLEHREDRYATRQHIAMMGELFFHREVRLPPLAPADLAAKVIAAAVELSDRALRTGPGPNRLLRVTGTCAALLQQWVGAIASDAANASVPDHPRSARHGGDEGANKRQAVLWNPRDPIQTQWATLRAMVGLAALTKTLTALYEDSAARTLDDGPALRTMADAAMDYADQVGLELDGATWEGVSGLPRTTTLPQDRVSELADRWRTFCGAPHPAPRRLQAFIDTLPE